MLRSNRNKYGIDYLSWSDLVDTPRQDLKIKVNLKIKFLKFIILEGLLKRSIEEKNNCTSENGLSRMVLWQNGFRKQYYK